MRVRTISRWSRALLPAVALAALPLHLPAQPAQLPTGAELAAAIDSIAAERLREGPIAGFSVAVSRGGELLVARGYGFADLEHRVPATAETVYRLGSITKPFTAAAILQLVEDGKLGLDDDMATHLPDYPTHGHRVTIRHLLTHTSGIRSYTGLGPRWQSKMALDLTHEEMLAFFKDEPFDFPPGTEYRYNNSGYYLLGLVIERLSHRTYASYVRERLTSPYGLESTGYCEERALVPHRARGYTPGLIGLQNAAPISMTHPFSAGALCSNAVDLVRWADALFGGRIVNESSLALMLEEARLESGNSVGYGLGVSLGEFEGRRMIGHGGAINGFSTHLVHFPDDGLTIAVLANTDGARPSRLTRQIARVALGLPEPEIKALPLGPEEARRYIGEYDLGELRIRVFEEGGRLRAQPTGRPILDLLYQGEHEFIVEQDPEIRIVFEVSGTQAVGLVLHQGGARVQAKRVR